MNLFTVADIIGLGSFAISGFLVGVRKGFDILGILIASFLTALGGGIIRDVVVDTTPFAFRENYPFLAVITALALGMALRIHKRAKIEQTTLFVISDSIGLVAFSITGALIGIEHHLNFFGVVFLSFITAIGGGIIRDTLVNDVPFVLVSEFYGTIAILAASALYLAHLLDALNPVVILIVGLASLALRLMAYFRKWHLPKL